MTKTSNRHPGNDAIGVCFTPDESVPIPAKSTPPSSDFPHCRAFAAADRQPQINPIGAKMTKTAALADIIILDNRQRQEFEPNAMQELFQSMDKNGLMHAPVLREYLGNLVLVAGERRIKTMEDMWALGVPVRYNNQIIPEGRIPYVTLGELSEVDAEEAELDENLRRKDLTWQELAAATERLSNLRKKQFAIRVDTEVRKIEDAGGGQDAIQKLLDSMKAPTPADIARELNPVSSVGKADGELGSMQASVRKQLIVAANLNNPLVQKAKNVDEAFKILKRQEESRTNAALGISVGATFNAGLHEIHNINCLHWMADPANRGRFDVILTDPPYGMGADNFGDGAGRLAGIEHHYDDSPAAFKELMTAWCPLAFAVAKAQAHAYVFCDIEHFLWLREEMRKAGWYVFRTPMINFKTNSGRVPLPDRGPRRQYEILLYAIKGDKPVTHIYPDVIQSQSDENMSHGAQKPVAVYQNLLQRSVRPGDSVLDSFAGSGTIFPAAHTFKVKAVGLEQSAEYFGMGLRRIQDLKVVEAISGEIEQVK